MAPARASLKSFLATARKALLAPPAQRPKPLTFVVGNESADLDSLCSALLLAYFRTHTPPDYTLHIPLSHLPRADLALRPELTAVLTPADLQPDDLITLSDLPDRERLDAKDTRWLLVDHNVLTGDLAARFGGQVFGCIDHHEDEGVVAHSSGQSPAEQPRLFAKCGSCMSLVLDHCQTTWNALAESDAACDDGTSPAACCDAALARVALAPVLIDTTSLTSKDKTTDWDVRAVEMAERKLRSVLSVRALSSSSSNEGVISAASATQTNATPDDGSTAADDYDRARYYDTLTHLKEQIAGLSYRDLLRRDYKRWDEANLSVGVSTVVQELCYVMAEAGAKSREAFLDALRGWAGEQGLDVAAVMTVSRPGGVFKRELLVWGMNERGVKVVRGFGERYKGELGLESWREGELDGGDGEEGGKEWRVCWVQKSVKHSRKQVAPMLRDAMKESSRL